MVVFRHTCWEKHWFSIWMTWIFSQLKRLTALFSGLSQTLRGIFVGPRSFSYFSAQGSEKGGEAEPTQKATLFPSGSALHPTMNGVLKNITLGTRLFFIPHNWAICPRVSSSLLVQSANETAVVFGARGPRGHWRLAVWVEMPQDPTGATH